MSHIRLDSHEWSFHPEEEEVLLHDGERYKVIDVVANYPDEQRRRLRGSELSELPTG